MLLLMLQIHKYLNSITPYHELDLTISHYLEGGLLLGMILKFHGIKVFSCINVYIHLYSHKQLFVRQHLRKMTNTYSRHLFLDVILISWSIILDLFIETSASQLRMLNHYIVRVFGCSSSANVQKSQYWILWMPKRKNIFPRFYTQYRFI